MNSGFFIAELFIATLSAPHFKTSVISSILLMPPPTVIGIKVSLLISDIVSNKQFLPYKLATTS